MASELPPDVLEKILIGLDVKDLIRFKAVCKSWQSFISSPRFIKSQLNHSIKIYHNNPNNKYRRLVISYLDYRFRFSYKTVDLTLDFNNCRLFGSCNGLVCISPFNAQVFVVNPLTGEVKKLSNPRVRILCWGFGYESSTDDYTVVIGFKKGVGVMRFQALKLKSDIWKVVGDVKYTSIRPVGMSCNREIHWLMNENYSNRMILSFDLIKDEFKEIHSQDVIRYRCSSNMCLGIIGGCLPCLFRGYVGQFGHHLGFPNGSEETGFPIFVQSLVSPHVNKPSRRYRLTMINKTNDKLIKGDPLVPEPVRD